MYTYFRFLLNGQLLFWRAFQVKPARSREGLTKKNPVEQGLSVRYFGLPTESVAALTAKVNNEFPPSVFSFTFNTIRNSIRTKSQHARVCRHTGGDCTLTALFGPGSRFFSWRRRRTCGTRTALCIVRCI